MPEGTDLSFEEFVRGSLPGLTRYAFLLTGQRHAGEDLVQDTLVKVSLAWRRVRKEGNPLAYARTTMLHTYLSWWRALRRRPASVALPEEWAAPDAYRAVDSRDLFRRALAQLPAAQRAVLVLGYLDDLSDDEIARLLSRRPATIRSLRQRGLATLRRHLLPEPARSTR
jgi:RNA polymerase sigma-70 factor (sigma-E family)